MTIIKKRGRIVRNIFVIDRYDAPLRVPTGCWEEMLSRMYSADPNADTTNRMLDIRRSFSDPKDREVKMRKLSCEMLRSTLYFLPSNFKRLWYDDHEASSRNNRGIRGHNKLRL